MSWIRHLISSVARVMGQVLAASRTVLGITVFLGGFATMAVGAVIAPVSAGIAVLAYMGAAQVVYWEGIVGSAAQGAWPGLLVLVVGIALLWVARRIDPYGPVRSSVSGRRLVR